MTAARSGRLEWAVKDSLLAYMARDADFRVVATDGGSFVDGRVQLPVCFDSDGGVRATGSVVLSAHGGALSVPLVGVRIERGALWIEDPMREPVDPPVRMRLVTLNAGAAPATFGTRLAAEADPLFLYRYMPREPFAPLSLVAEDGTVPLVALA